MKTLKEATDAEIQEEIRLRHEAWKVAEEKRAQEAASTLFKYVEPLIALVPKHNSYRSGEECSDADPCNADVGCTRCALLDAQLVGYPKYELERITVRKLW
jgi:hypothetical protein